MHVHSARAGINPQRSFASNHGIYLPCQSGCVHLHYLGPCHLQSRWPKRWSSPIWHSPANHCYPQLSLENLSPDFLKYIFFFYQLNPILIKLFFLSLSQCALFNIFVGFSKFFFLLYIAKQKKKKSSRSVHKQHPCRGGNGIIHTTLN